jgi:hypothetical protein
MIEAQLNGGDPDPDQVGSGSFLSDPDPLKALAVCSSIFHTRKQNRRSLILDLWNYYSTDRRFETADFSTVNRVCEF